jgi:sugar O-acyltransferase (sialic acid O-acetyltransferase NeuD family)
MNNPGNQIFIYGAGGHAKSVIAIVRAESKWKIQGIYVDSEFRNREVSVLGCPIFDREFQLEQSGIRRAFVAIGDNHARRQITGRLGAIGIDLVHTIHPSAIVMSNSRVGAGAMVHAQSVLGPDCRIGQGVIIRAMVSVGHDSEIGDYAHLTPGVRIGGGVVIGEAAFLGMGAVVLPGVKIGKNTQVGANSVVHKDLGDNLVTVGNPARVIRRTASGHQPS